MNRINKRIKKKYVYLFIGIMCNVISVGLSPMRIQAMNEAMHPEAVNKDKERMQQLAQVEQVLARNKSEIPTAPELTLNQNPIKEFESNLDYLISGIWTDKESQTVSLFYRIDEEQPVVFATQVKNKGLGSKNKFEYYIPSQQLSTGTHRLSIYVVDETNLKSAEATTTFKVKGILSFTRMPKETDLNLLGSSNNKRLATRLGELNNFADNSCIGGRSWHMMSDISPNLWKLIDVPCYKNQIKKRHQAVSFFL